MITGWLTLVNIKTKRKKEKKSAPFAEIVISKRTFDESANGLAQTNGLAHWIDMLMPKTAIKSVEINYMLTLLDLMIRSKQN